MNNDEIATKELNLNIINQKVQVTDFTQIGYEWDKGVYVFILLIPNKMLGFKPKAGRLK
jgi:hypothetical protein